MALSKLCHFLLAIFIFGILHGVKSAPVPVSFGGSPDIKAIIDAQVRAQKFISYEEPFVSINSSLEFFPTFLSGPCDIGVSPFPFPAKLEVLFKGQKLTIPHAVFPISPFHPSVPGVKLTASQIADILRGTVLKWPPPASGPITPVLRADPAGVVHIFTKFLQKAAPKWPSSFVGDGPFTFGNKNAVTASGAAGVANKLKITKGGFGFGQSGVYSNAPYNLKEIAVKNKAGVFVTVTGNNPADVLAAVPKSPPDASGSWSEVSLVWQDGSKTHPIVSFAYVFYRTKYSPRVKRDAIVNFGLFAQTTAGQALLFKLHFYPLPSILRLSNTNALKTIKVG